MSAHVLRDAHVEIYQHDDDPDVWLQISGDLFGPFKSEDDALIAIPAALKGMP